MTLCQHCSRELDLLLDECEQDGRNGKWHHTSCQEQRWRVLHSRHLLKQPDPTKKADEVER